MAVAPRARHPFRSRIVKRPAKKGCTPTCFEVHDSWFARRPLARCSAAVSARADAASPTGSVRLSPANRPSRRLPGDMIRTLSRDPVSPTAVTWRLYVLRSGSNGVTAASGPVRTVRTARSCQAPAPPSPQLSRGGLCAGSRDGVSVFAPQYLTEHSWTKSARSSLGGGPVGPHRHASDARKPTRCKGYEGRRPDLGVRMSIY